MPFWLQNQTLRPIFVPLLELKPDSLVLHLFVLISLQNYNVFATLQNYNVFIFDAVFRFRISGRWHFISDSIFAISDFNFVILYRKK